jgi:hypothetical protein
MTHTDEPFQTKVALRGQAVDRSGEGRWCRPQPGAIVAVANTGLVNEATRNKLSSHRYRAIEGVRTDVVDEQSRPFL